MGQHAGRLKLAVHAAPEKGKANAAIIEVLAEALGLAGAACPDGPASFDMGPGRQWFSVKGVTEANRPARIAEVLPGVRQMIESLGDPRETWLVGFSQGAILALHLAAAGLPLAGVVAIAGRLAGPVPGRTDWPPIHQFHGADDPVMPVGIAHATNSWLREAGADPRLTVFDALGHSMDARVLAAVRDILPPG